MQTALEAPLPETGLLLAVSADISTVLAAPTADVASISERARGWSQTIESFVTRLEASDLVQREQALVLLLDEVRGCFTRDDDLPNGLLGRIDAMLDPAAGVS